MGSVPSLPAVPSAFHFFRRCPLPAFLLPFWRDRCGPCKLIAPVFEELSDEFSSRAKFIKVDVDENSDAAQRYGVSAMPTFLFIKGGEVVEKVMGANAERLREVRS